MSQPEMMKYLPVITCSLCGVAVTLAWKLISPKSGSNRELYDWPDYWKLKLRRDVTIGLCTFYAGAALVLWFFSSIFSPFWFGAIATWSIVSGIITCGCALFAAFTLKEIIEE